MNIANRKDLANLGLCDFPVLDTLLDIKNRAITFKTMGAWFRKDFGKIELGEGFITISNYNAIEVTSYNAKKDKKVLLEENTLIKLSEICKIEINNEKIVVKGFDQSGAEWIEYSIIGGNVAGQYTDC